MLCDLIKSRCCIYVRAGISYIRRSDLEGQDNNLLIITVDLGDIKYVIINVYRSFSIQGGVATDIRFANQVEIIRKTITENPNLVPIIVGDFNLNYKMINNPQYHLKSLFEKLTTAM